MNIAVVAAVMSMFYIDKKSLTKRQGALAVKPSIKCRRLFTAPQSLTTGCVFNT